MLGGTVMNLVTAVVLLFIAFVLIGTPQPTTKVAEVINCLPTAITQSNSCEADAELSPAAKIKLLGYEPSATHVICECFFGELHVCASSFFRALSLRW